MIKAGAAVSVTRCTPVEVVPRSHWNCTEVQAIYNGTVIFVYPFSNVINWPGTVPCSDVVPPRYKLGGKFYSSYPEMQECHDLARLPIDNVQIETIQLRNIS